MSTAGGSCSGSSGLRDGRGRGSRCLLTTCCLLRPPLLSAPAAKYIFQYPAGWKSEIINKRDKGTQGVDCRVRRSPLAPARTLSRHARRCVSRPLPPACTPCNHLPFPSPPPLPLPDLQPRQQAAAGVCDHAGACGGGQPILPHHKRGCHAGGLCGGRLRHAGGWGVREGRRRREGEGRWRGGIRELGGRGSRRAWRGGRRAQAGRASRGAAARRSQLCWAPTGAAAGAAPAWAQDALGDAVMRKDEFREVDGQQYFGEEGGAGGWGGGDEGSDEGVGVMRGVMRGWG